MYADKIFNLRPNPNGEGNYDDGFDHALRDAAEIANIGDALIGALCNALRDRHADYVVDKLLEKYKV